MSFKFNSRYSKTFVAVILLVTMGTTFFVEASAAVAPVTLGNASSFAVLAGSTVTNTGSSVVSGDVGLYPGTSITGFPPGSQNLGISHITDSVAQLAQNANIEAYGDTQGRTPSTTIGGDLGGLTLVAGLYKASSSLGITGTLTLNGQNDPNSVFIIQVGSALTTASSSKVVLENDASACNIYWQVTSSATLGTNSQFAGTILALTSITLTTGASVDGRVLAQNGAVTLDTNRITTPNCITPTTTTTTTTTTTVPVTTTTTIIPTTTTTTTPPIIGPPATGGGPLKISLFVQVTGVGLAFFNNNIGKW